MSDFENKKILITGAASGFGRLLAQKLAQMGSHLILWDINEEGLKSVEGDILKAGGIVFTYYCDLSDRHAICSTAKSVLADHGHVDILINNAGVISGRPILEITDEQILEEWRRDTGGRR